MEESTKYEELRPYAKILADNLAQAQKVTFHLLEFAKQGDYARFLADANLYMELMSILVIAWQWLKQANAAKEALLTGQLKQKASFYQSQVHTMKFFFKYEVPKTLGLTQSLMDAQTLTLLEEKTEIFG